MTMNPTEEAHDSYKNEVDKLKAEVSVGWRYPMSQSFSCVRYSFQIERLKRKNRKMEEERQDMTNRLDETSGGTTMNIQEVQFIF